MTPTDFSPCPRFSYPEDFDHDKFDAWLGQSDITGNAPVEGVLVDIEVAERAGDRLLFRNAGVLFFARNVRRFFPEASITCLWARAWTKFASWTARTSTAGSWRTSKTPCASSSAIPVPPTGSRA